MSGDKAFRCKKFPIRGADIVKECSVKHSALQGDCVEIGLGQVRASKICAIKAGVGKVAHGKICPFKGSKGQACFGKDGFFKPGLFEQGSLEVGVLGKKPLAVAGDNACAGQIRA